MPNPDAYFDADVHLSMRRVVIDTEAANMACHALLRAVAGAGIENADTWHGGTGADLCECCRALVILRSAAGYNGQLVDHLRP